MSKTFTDIVANIATDIQDTTAEMKTIIGRYVNDRYRQVFRATNFEIVDHDYTISVVAATQTYSLPANFGKEMYVVDKTNNKRLKRTTFNQLGYDYPDQLDQSGQIDQYVIYRDDSNNLKIYFFKNPSENVTVGMPYIVRPRTDLSGTDEPINDFGDLIETGAKADALRYKRQYQKAGAMEVMFDSMLDEYMWDQENQENDPHQFTASDDDYPRQRDIYWTRS